MKELGLSPVWVRRHGSAAAGTVESTSMTANLAAATQIAAPSTGLEPATSRAARIHAQDWAQLKSSASTCTACVLHGSRKQAVLGVGDVKAEWLFVGEGPGAEEDERGEPFVGQAGKLLDNMLAAIALQRGNNVYIANVVKCRPPGNRTPEPAEAHACEPYLTRQIELIRPRLIVALGKVAAQNLLGIEATLASLRGRIHQYRNTPLIVTYHPAYLLRNLVDKSKSWEDLCFAVETMQALKQHKAVPN
ncbi:MAG: uracil-DNA glycosylase [Prolixibacteraceae bacterium]|nr:uracil-DNA glycosylase [Burkholderiales bacterium]